MAGKLHTDTLSGVTLTTRDFPDFHALIMALRFPIEVAEVLELRDLINHSAAVYEEATEIPQNREFRESLEGAIQSFGIENRQHSERLVRVLNMLRGMHYQHIIGSRDAERRLREQQTENRIARRHSLRNGVLALLATLASGLAWFTLMITDWKLQLLPLVTAIAALGYFHALPRLDREMERLTRDLNDVLRKRVDTLNWRTLIHKLALLLGYKQIQGIDVFRHELGDQGNGSYYQLH
jgi:hypothetical protein